MMEGEREECSRSWGLEKELKMNRSGEIPKTDKQMKKQAEIQRDTEVELDLQGINKIQPTSFYLFIF